MNKVKVLTKGVGLFNQFITFIRYSGKKMLISFLC
jgi:hypothetical protein